MRTVTLQHHESRKVFVSLTIIDLFEIIYTGFLEKKYRF